MKLKEWSEKVGIKYLTAYRWFKAGKLPVKAYQTTSGTIIVEEELESERAEKQQMNNNAVSLFLKKTVEFSKAESSIEDFAAWILSTFQLKVNEQVEGPKYSRNMPKPEEVQKHFQQFLKPKGDKPKPAMFVASEETLEAIARTDSLPPGAVLQVLDAPEVTANGGDLTLQQSLEKIFPAVSNNTTTYSNCVGGLVTRSVDNITPQLNYTGSTNCALTTNALSPSLDASSMLSTTSACFLNNSNTLGESAFKPTQKELQSTSEMVNGTSARSRRGRKSHKNRSSL